MGEPIATVGDLAGICGHDGTDWIKALIDAAGHLQIDVVDSGGADLKDVLDKLTEILTELNSKLETADLDLDASGRLSANAHQYDGSAWRKSNLLFGYNAIWDEDLGGTATGASYYDTTSTIPSGEVWVLQAISARNTTRNPTWVFTYVVRASGADVYLSADATPGTNIPGLAVGNWVLGPGDVAYIYLTGCQADDVIQAGVIGYKMKLNM